jgi:hypothetical protein
MSNIKSKIKVRLMKKKSQIDKDIEAVDEVLSWDPRGSEEEYLLVQTAQEAFARLILILKREIESK